MALPQQIYITVLLSFYLLASIALFLNSNRLAKFLGFYLAILGFSSLSSLIGNSLPVLIILMMPVYHWYTKVFFHQKLHKWWLQLVPITLLTIIILTIDDPNVNTLLLSTYCGIWILVIIRNLQKQVRARGISFYNPGKSASWYRSFTLFQAITVIVFLREFYLHDNQISQVLVTALLVNVVAVLYPIIKKTTVISSLPEGQKYARSSLTQEQKFSILNRLELLMTEEKIYCDPDITLTKLSQRLNTSSHSLSQVLNEQKRQTFAEYMMNFRIDEARKLIREDEQGVLKVEEIAMQVGYHSKSAFNTAFKRISGQTPSEFRKQSNVRSYREERLAGRTIHHYGKVPNTFDVVINKIDMVRNFFNVFVRNLRRNPTFTAINALGLVLGFTSSLFIFLFINHEISYDQALPRANDIYRIAWFGGNPQTRTPHPMAQAMVRDFPEVEQGVSLTPWFGSGLSRQKITVKNPETNIKFDEPDFFFADSTFLDVFGFQLISGNAATALKEPGGILLSERMAQKYFGSSDPLGKRLYIGSDEIPTLVIGVLEDTPEQTHFHYNFVISYVTLKSMLPPDDFWMQWGDFGHYNYVRLREGTDPDQLKNKIPEWFLGYNDWSESAKASLLNGTNRFELQPITDIHLHSHIRWELESNGNILYIYILTGAVFFILTIASINYINLTTAKSVDRAKEIGIRKTLGARRTELSFQFLIESIMFCLLTGAIAVVLTMALIPFFNELSGKSFIISSLLDSNLLFLAPMGILIIGLIAGTYPALILSSFKVTTILMGKFSRSRSGNNLSRILVIVQFVISAVLITASLIILRQTNYLRDKPLGFNMDELITVPLQGDQLRRNHMVIGTELKKIQGVQAVSAISNVPGGQFNNNAIWKVNDPDNTVDVSELTADYTMLETLDIELLDGRNFSPVYALDSAGGSFILNEAAVRALQLDEPIGQKIVWNLEEGNREGQVVGVVRDFHYKSLHQSIQPMIIDMHRSLPGYLIIRIENQEIPRTISAVRDTYKEFDANNDFQYSFLDESIDDLYQAEIRTLKIFGIFAIIALFLASLGLLGIVMSMMNQRIKEVGLRKIHGASMAQIILLVNKRFIRLIAVSLLVGLPLAYFMMNDWLAEFPYHTTAGIVPFIASTGVLLMVAIVVTSLVVLRVASANPVDALRHE